MSDVFAFCNAGINTWNVVPGSWKTGGMEQQDIKFSTMENRAELPGSLFLDISATIDQLLQ